MRKFYNVTAITLLAGSISPMAWAQSSVTLYGIVDGGINYLSDAQTGKGANGLVGHRQYSIQDGTAGGASGSRFGLRGIEDLGGGLAAIFQLENGFSVNTGALGQGSDFFGRQAWVGLRSNSIGTFTLGRQYDPVVSFVQPFVSAAQWAGYIGAHPGDLDNLENTHRINNSLKFTSPNFDGFTFGGLYGVGGVPGSTGQNQIWSIGAGYANGPLSLGVGYLNARNPNFSYFGTNPSAGTTPTSDNLGALGSTTAPQSNPIYAGYASARTFQLLAVGSSYVIGNATLGATYSNTQFRELGDTVSSGPNPFGYNGTATFNNAEVNFKYQISPVLLAGVAYDYTRASGAAGRSGATYHQGAAGIDYFVSKRTDLYGIAVYQHAGGTDSLNQPAVADITGQTASAENHQIAVRIGIRHRF